MIDIVVLSELLGPVTTAIIYGASPRICSHYYYIRSGSEDLLPLLLNGVTPRTCYHYQHIAFRAQHDDIIFESC